MIERRDAAGNRKIPAPGRAGALTVHVGGRYPLAEAARAYADIASRRTTGKLLLIP